MVPKSDELKTHPAFEGFPLDPVEDAELAASFCARGCASIPNISFWDVPAPIMLERGASCRLAGCDWDTPTHMAEAQHKSLVQRHRISRHTKIAVVGSSGSLRTTRYGAEIDSHDVVVRINGAPCGGKYADMVGQKLDVDYTAPAGLLDHPKFIAADSNGTHACGMTQKQPVSVVFQSFAICASPETRSAHAAWARSKIPSGATSAAGEKQPGRSTTSLFTESPDAAFTESPGATSASGVWMVDPDWACALWRDELHRAASHFPSTGMNAVGFFASLARSLGAPAPSVYGYGGNQRCEKYYDCYARGIDYSGNNWHPFAEEHKALHAWHEAGHIILH